MSAFVFLGPSLPLAEARAILGDADYLPPVKMGDVYTLVASRARPGDRIAIIDGFFELVPAVWHKEILFALSKGVHVYGASSMGALRAAELHGFGMRGVGRIFEAFRDSRLEADDEVAVAHADAEHGYRSLSLALASIRFALAELVEDGSIGPEESAQWTAAMAALPYQKRSWAALLSHAVAAGAGEAATAGIRRLARSRDAKATDAAELLGLVASEAGSTDPFVPDFTFQHTSFWTSLTRSMALRVDSASAEPAADQDLRRSVAAFVRAAGAGREDILDSALLDRLSIEAAQTYRPDSIALQHASQRLRRKHGLTDPETLRAWRDRQDIGAAEWQQLLVREARRHWLRRNLVGQLDPFVIAALKADGRYAEFRERADAARRLIDSSAASKPALSDYGLEPADLQHWYEGLFGPMAPNPAEHAQSLGFTTLRDFVDALLVCYLASLGPEHGERPKADASSALEKAR